MIKVWILTVIFFDGGSVKSGSSMDVQQYEYKSEKSCQVWQNYWKDKWKVGTTHCTQVERVK